MATGLLLLLILMGSAIHPLRTHPWPSSSDGEGHVGLMEGYLDKTIHQCKHSRFVGGQNKNTQKKSSKQSLYHFSLTFLLDKLYLKTRKPHAKCPSNFHQISLLLHKPPPVHRQLAQFRDATLREGAEGSQFVGSDVEEELQVANLRSRKCP